MDDSRKYIHYERQDWKLLVIQLLLTGLVLCIFALFHHVLPEWQVRKNGIGAPSGVVVRSTPAPEQTPQPQAEQEAQSAAEPTPVPTEDPRSPWQIRFAEHFSEQPLWGDESYSSPNVSVTVKEYAHTEQYPQMSYYVADVYVGDISCLRSGMPLGAGFDSALNIAADHGAIAAINGDSALSYRDGILVRNGLVYGSYPIFGDVCVLRYDGVMETFLAGEYTAEEIFAEEPYQCWQFGPALLEEDGRPRAWFNIAEELLGAHPRTAIGYFEPGHYCFVVVDGRRPGHSSGADMHALAQIMSDLGCLSAYNLDGGACSMMVFQGEWANQPCPAGAGNAYRYLSDMILVAEPEEGEES